MKPAVFSPTSETEEGEKLSLERELIARMEEDASQSLDCENNCLSGIKWQTDHYNKESERKKRDVFNGFRKLKTGIVTHGGRRSKLPARFMETDSESDSNSTRKRVRERKDSKVTSGERPTPCSVTKRRTSKNGSTGSLQKASIKRPKGEKNDELLCSALVEGFDAIVDIKREDILPIVDSNSKMNTGFDLSTRTPTQNLKRNFVSSPSEAESSSEEIRPRKRGRPFKNKFNMEKAARAKLARSLVESPHGDNCLTSATKASLTSHSDLKTKRKKRKILNGLRRAKSELRDFSAGESSGSEALSPVRRGRPPKHLSSHANKTKQREFGAQNGARKPWVRPVLKALHKRALFESPEKRQNSSETASDVSLTKVKTKLVKVNGRTLPQGCVNTVVKRRGRKPKDPSQKLKKSPWRKRKDSFVFTDEVDSTECTEAQLQARISKLDKIQRLKMQKQFGKKPIGAGRLKSLKNHNTAIANKLKNKSIRKAKHGLHKNSSTAVSSEDLPATTTDGQQNRRRHRNKIDRVLGMRQKSNSEYEFLVQWKDGTSNWTTPDQAADYAQDLKEFLTHEFQERTVVSRLVFKAYCKDNLDQYPASDPQEVSDVDSNCSDIPAFEDITDGELSDVEVERTPKKRGRKPRDSTDSKEFVCKEVSVQRLEDCVHIVLRRSSGKQTRVNLRIIDSLTFAMEDAAIDNVDLVVISGLGDDLFCGVDLDTMVTVPLDCEMKNYRKDVDKIRYLIQTIQHFPKPIVATISKPAHGLGAQLVAMCDMVCDEASLGSPIDVASAKANGIVPYCFPRLMGHSAVSEQLLMGQPISSPTVQWKDSLGEVFDGANFTSQLLTSVKAMNDIPSISCPAVYDRDYVCSVREEQCLAKEIELEKERLQESLKDLTAFWNDITSQVS
ncbi:predicted protein [Nematostella vectensis]|uniref:Chromo domain-containing protein n=1 Tax=Nematostella vectensis TaxID=45351 RepID=A7SKT7_NEMVE|nr:predicted protein [Nematostella vectensis]|eukprot:XP_001627774.1 predicted protein [Nematostella vectensis]